MRQAQRMANAVSIWLQIYGFAKVSGNRLGLAEKPRRGGITGHVLFLQGYECDNTHSAGYGHAVFH